jgi:AraC-like DNA-binding protein
MRHVAFLESALRKRQPAGYRFETGRYELFQAIFVRQGELLYQDIRETRRLRQGQVVLLRMNSGFTLSCVERGYSGVAYHAVGHLPAEMVGESEVLTASAEVRVLAELMERQLRSPGPEASAVLLGLARAMAWEAMRCSDSFGRPVTGRDWAETAKALLEATLSSGASAREILSALPLSYRQVSRHFAAVFGCSPKHYQLQARIEQVRRLLEQTSLPITSIAMELGYCSSQHLATQFQAIIGQTPGAYRGSRSEHDGQIRGGAGAPRTSFVR